MPRGCQTAKCARGGGAKRVASPRGVTDAHASGPRVLVRSVDAFIDAMGQPAVRDIAAGTLKKLGAIRERIDDVQMLAEHCGADLLRVEEPEAAMDVA